MFSRKVYLKNSEDISQKIKGRAHIDNAAELAFNESKYNPPQTPEHLLNPCKWFFLNWTLKGFSPYQLLQDLHCIKIARIRSFSGPYFPGFRMNTQIYFANLQIRKNSRKNANKDTFYAVIMPVLSTGLGSFR